MKIQQDAYRTTDRLYGSITFDSEEKELIGQLSFMHGLSLSSVPNRCLPIGEADTRLHHSLGTNHLVKRTLLGTSTFREYSRELRFAALLHDAGHPCFSHLSEPFLEMLCGASHETYILERLERRGISKTLKRLSINLQLMYRLINGLLPPFSTLLHGSMDVDNLDNVTRYLVSSGICPNAAPFEDIASAFGIHKNRLVLRQHRNIFWIRIHEWLDQRHQAYQFIHSKRNIAPAAMLHRAMEFAYNYDLLKPSFFDLSDEQALEYLNDKCGQQSRYLVQQTLQLKTYTQAYSYSTKHPSPELLSATSGNTERLNYRYDLANSLSTALNISPTEIAVYAGEDRGIRKIDIPLINDDGSITEIDQSDSHPIWHIQVYIHPRLSLLTSQVEKLMKAVPIESL